MCGAALLPSVLGLQQEFYHHEATRMTTNPNTKGGDYKARKSLGV